MSESSFLAVESGLREEAPLYLAFRQVSLGGLQIRQEFTVLSEGHPKLEAVCGEHIPGKHSS